MTDAERLRLDDELKQEIEDALPKFARACHAETDLMLMHQDSSRQIIRTELSLLGKAIKYAGLLGKDVHVIGRNAQTVIPHQLATARLARSTARCAPRKWHFAHLIATIRSRPLSCP